MPREGVACPAGFCDGNPSRVASLFKGMGYLPLNLPLPKADSMGKILFPKPFCPRSGSFQRSLQCRGRESNPHEGNPQRILSPNNPNLIEAPSCPESVLYQVFPHFSL